MRHLMPVMFLLLVARFGCVSRTSRTDETAQQWRHIMTFDVMDSQSEIRANVDSRYLVVAKRVSSLGWDIGLYRRPSADSKDPGFNLLDGGRNLHGVQPWHVFAWTKEQRIFPDTRIAGYGKQYLKIRMIDCAVDTRGESPAFTTGKVAVYFPE